MSYATIGWRCSSKEEFTVTTKARVTKEGLLIPKEVADRALGEGSGEVEILEEPGRLLIVAEQATAGDADVAEGRTGLESGDDPILGLGRNPVRTGVRDGSTEHDRHLYGAGG